MSTFSLWRKLINLRINWTVWKNYLNSFENFFLSEENKACITKFQNIYDLYMLTNELQFDEN